MLALERYLRESTQGFISSFRFSFVPFVWKSSAAVTIFCSCSISAFPDSVRSALLLYAVLNALMYGVSSTDSPIAVIPPGLGLVICLHSSCRDCGAPLSMYLKPSAQLFSASKSAVFHAKSAIANSAVLEASACSSGFVTIPMKFVRPFSRIALSPGPITKRAWFTSFTGQFSHINASLPFV